MVCVRKTFLSFSLEAGIFLSLANFSQASVIIQNNSFSTTDHGKHEVLQKDFQNAQEITAACLSCHNEAAKQVHQTVHWTWKHFNDQTKMQNAYEEHKSKFGKGALTFNNFCIAIGSNEPKCTTCHAGYGWKDKSFDFTSEENVDCLVCHDSTGLYEKADGTGGMPMFEKTDKDGVKTPVDFKTIVANVAKPKIANCASCHFMGGGGDAVKHGDLDSSLLNASRSLDVHLSKEGANFTCQRCHTTENHQIAGRSYSTPAFEERTTLIENDMASRITCESCHTATPHKTGHKANDHTDKVACQTCHIPAFAREKATEMYWDWSQAGKLKDGKPYSVKNEFGTNSYASLKGSFDWQKNVIPEYHWYSGSMDYLLLTDKVEDTSKPVEITKIIGNANDPKARIMPFKAHRGKQPFDPVNKTFVAPHLYGKDDTAYWKNFDWQKAIKAGQEYMGLPYSDEYTFVETVYYYPITHMVAPKDNTVACASCHSQDSLLKNIDGVWIPGRDSEGFIDTFGWILVFGSLAGVLLHACLRIMTRNKRK